MYLLFRDSPSLACYHPFSATANGVGGAATTGQVSDGNDFCNNHRYAWRSVSTSFALLLGGQPCLLWPLQLRQQAFVHELSTGTHLLATLHLLRSSVARVSHTLTGPGLLYLLHTIRVACTYANHARCFLRLWPNLRSQSLSKANLRLTSAPRRHHPLLAGVERASGEHGLRQNQGEGRRPGQLQHEQARSPGAQPR